jgi:enamine deaminase RidA (YjgF/YER057c/UK114 family)
MSRIIRTEANAILAKAVEYHGFVYLQGVVPTDATQDIAGQTEQVLAQIDELLEIHGTDKTRLLQAHIWLKQIGDRDAMNKVWSAWLPEGGAPARACVQAVLAHPDYLVEIMVTACR